MNQQKDNSWVLFVGMVGVALYLVGVFILAVATFAAFALTVLAIIAWNNPLRLGAWSFEPVAARSFVVRGAAGAALVPAFVGFFQLLSGVFVEWSCLPYLMLGGYVGGSVGIAYLTRNSSRAEAGAAPTLQIEKQPTTQLRDRPPFEFASWDDEDERE